MDGLLNGYHTKAYDGSPWTSGLSLWQLESDGYYESADAGKLTIWYGDKQIYPKPQ
jgi:hypothetical protein